MILNPFSPSAPAAPDSEKFELPLEQSEWRALAYNKIPPHIVTFQDQKIQILVRKSAGPLVYKFKSPRNINGFRIKATWKGEKSVEVRDFDEDSILRLGLVVTGSKTLSRVQRLFAAQWVRELYKLAPPDVGLDRIEFINVTNQKSMLGRSRSHPKSDLLLERFVKVVETPGDFQVETKLETPLSVAGIWLSVDGDDTKSDFELTISSIQIF